MGRLYRCRRDITRLRKELPDGSGSGTVHLQALRIKRGVTVGVAGREGLAGMVVARMAVMVTRDGQTWGPE